MKKMLVPSIRARCEISLAGEPCSFVKLNDEDSSAFAVNNAARLLFGVELQAKFFF